MKNLAAAICPDETSYHNLSSLSIVNQDKLTYPLTLYFQDENGSTAAKNRAALYNMPLTYVMRIIVPGLMIRIISCRRLALKETIPGNGARN